MPGAPSVPASCYVRAASQACALAGAGPAPVVGPPFEQTCTAAGQALGEELFTAMSAEGAALLAEQAIDYARNTLGSGESPVR